MSQTLVQRSIWFIHWQFFYVFVQALLQNVTTYYQLDGSVATCLHNCAGRIVNIVKIECPLHVVKRFAHFCFKNQCGCWIILTLLTFPYCINKYIPSIMSVSQRKKAITVDYNYLHLRITTHRPHFKAPQNFFNQITHSFNYQNKRLHKSHENNTHRFILLLKMTGRGSYWQKREPVGVSRSQESGCLVSSTSW